MTMHEQNEKNGVTRRTFLKVAGALGALGALGGLGIRIRHTLGQTTQTPSFYPENKRLYASSRISQEPEASIDLDSGDVRLNPKYLIRSSVCLGCFSNCGNRVKIERATGRIVKVYGNPYHPNAAENPLPYETPFIQSYWAQSRYKDMGLKHRATVCPRGNSAFEQTYDPKRILIPLKRNGPRGSGRWKPIDYDTLLNEVVEGGKLFQDLGENHVVEGFRNLHDHTTPIDPNHPEIGPKSYQVVLFGGRFDGRDTFFKRFAQGFGTPNAYGHRGFCGSSRRVAYQAFTDEWKDAPHMKPDYEEADFVLFMGASPGQAGNPYQPILRYTAEGASERHLRFVVVDPVLPNISGSQYRWIPIRPGTDGALVMGMMRWIFENNRFNARYLEATRLDVAEERGFASYTNATYLIIDEPTHPSYRKFMRGRDLGLSGEAEELPVVVAADGSLKTIDQAPVGTLFFEGHVSLPDGSTIRVMTALSKLRQNAYKRDLKTYSAISHVPEKTIIELADTFTSRGTRVGVEHHGGIMHPNGFYTSYAMIILNALVGSVNMRGGMTKSAGGYKAYAEGPRYDLNTIPDQPKVKGLRVGRDKFPYENTPEYKEKVKAGQNPYPASRMYYPFAVGLGQEVLISAKEKSPYPVKILLIHQANPLYTVPGLYQKDILDMLQKPEELPLIISIDVVMGETSAYADYIIPDTVFYESWGLPSVWNGMLTKVSAVRYPVVTPLTPKLADGRHINMETFLIDLAKRVGVAGFGEKGMKDINGRLLPIDKQEDFYLRAVANIAFDQKPVPDASQEEMDLIDLESALGSAKNSVTPEEWKKIAYVLIRGGRFESRDQAYIGDRLKYRWERVLNIYNEQVATGRHPLTGEYFEGTADYIPPAWPDGTPLDKAYPANEWPFTIISYKSRYRSVSTLANIPRLQNIRTENAIQINAQDAARLGIRDGDTIKVITAAGEATGVALTRQGLMPGTLAVAFGYGHWEYGSKPYAIGNDTIQGDAKRGAGFALNPLVPRDPHGWLVNDPVGGSIARNDTRAKVVKV